MLSPTVVASRNELEIMISLNEPAEVPTIAIAVVELVEPLTPEPKMECYTVMPGVGWVIYGPPAPASSLMVEEFSTRPALVQLTEDTPEQVKVIPRLAWKIVRSL